MLLALPDKFLPLISLFGPHQAFEPYLVSIHSWPFLPCRVFSAGFWLRLEINCKYQFEPLCQGYCILKVEEHHLHIPSISGVFFISPKDTDRTFFIIKEVQHGRKATKGRFGFSGETSYIKDPLSSSITREVGMFMLCRLFR
jgi:hypothetical protein